MDGKITQEIKSKKGVRQRREKNISLQKVNCGKKIWLNKSTRFSSLLYAEDLILLAETENITIKQKKLAFVRNNPVRIKILIENKAVEEASGNILYNCSKTGEQ